MNWSCTQATISDLQAQDQFIQFSQTFNKKYEVSEVFKRLAIFKDKLEFIQAHNAGNHTYTLGVNEFSDLSHEEFVAQFVGKLDNKNPPVFDSLLEFDGPIPNDVDWRQQGAVTGVKNQGQCGSCWAFSTTGAMEGSNKIRGGGLNSLSEQQLVDCAGSAGNQGCSGGWPSKAIDWAARTGGLCSGSAYPYRGVQGRCASGCSRVATTGGSQGLSASDSGLTGGLSRAPVSVAIEASGRAFQSYRSGVFSGPCGRNLDHAVLAVGFTGNAYIVKNSWGTSWGEGGYIRMARPQNTCGIQQVACYAR
jgi:cathepsin L